MSADDCGKVPQRKVRRRLSVANVRALIDVYLEDASDDLLYMKGEFDFERYKKAREYYRAARRIARWLLGDELSIFEEFEHGVASLNRRVQPFHSPTVKCGPCERLRAAWKAAGAPSSVVCALLFFAALALSGCVGSNPNFRPDFDGAPVVALDADPPPALDGGAAPDLVSAPADLATAAPLDLARPDGAAPGDLAPPACPSLIQTVLPCASDPRCAQCANVDVRCTIESGPYAGKTCVVLCSECGQ